MSAAVLRPQLSRLRHKLLPAFVALFAALLAICATPPSGARAQTATARITRVPTPINDVLLNPGKGLWIFAGDMIDWNYRVLLDDAKQPLNEVERAKEQAAATSDWHYGKTQIDGVWKPAKWPDYRSVVNLGYFRFIWSDIEPEKGKYNWEKIDKAIKPFKDAGKQFAFGVVAASSLSSYEYDTPKWVFDDGAAFDEFSIPQAGGTARRKVYPVWDDPTYLKHLHEMERALAQRYKNDPAIAFVDVRGYGNYGEQHLYNIDPNQGSTYTYAKTRAISSDQLRDLYLKPFAEAFAGGSVKVVTCCGESEYAPAYAWAVEHGIGVRRDGILGGDGKYDASGNFIFWSDASECAVANNRQPCVFELAFLGSYTNARARGQWNTGYLSECVTRGNASYLLMYYDMYRDNQSYLNWMANRVGYWLRIEEATYDAQVAVGEPLELQLTIRNDGAAPLFEPNKSFVALLDADDRVVAKRATSWDAFAWKPDTSTKEQASITFDGVGAGAYRLAYGLFENSSDEKPTYLLGSSGKTEDGWYVLGEVTLVEKQDAPVKVPTPQTAGSPQTPRTANGAATPKTADTAQTPHTADTAQTPQTAVQITTPTTATNPDTPQTTHEPQIPQTHDEPRTPETATTPLTPGVPHWDFSQGAWRFLYPDGTRASGWIWDGFNWYYLGFDGAAVSGWLWDRGEWYYLNEAHDGRFGAMVSGWHWDGNWYWLTQDPALQRFGSMARNAWVQDRGRWYLAGTNGFIVYGWQWFEGAWWYLDTSDGHLLRATRTPDGELVDQLGRWMA